LKIGTTAQRQRALNAIKGFSGKYLPNIGGYQSYQTHEGEKGNVASEKIILLNTIWWSLYALQALMEAGKEKDAVEYMRICWGMMLDNGATSFWEDWDGRTSLCHSFSAAPATILPAYILGIRPTRPGFNEFMIQPSIADLTWAKGTVPTPRGKINIAWMIKKTRKNSTFCCQLNIPQGTVAKFIVPKEFKYARLKYDGRQLMKKKKVAITSGKHDLELY